MTPFSLKVSFLKSRKYNFMYIIIILDDNARYFPICHSLDTNGVVDILLISKKNTCADSDLLMERSIKVKQYYHC